MPLYLNHPGVAGCVANIVAFVAVLLLVNVPAPFLGLEFDDDTPANVLLAPPGWLVVVAWLVLFPAMGVARWLLLGTDWGGGAIFGLAVLCATYAYYTLGLAKLTAISPAVFGLVGNLVVIAVASRIAVRVAPLQGTAAGLIALVALWTAFASISVVQIVAKL
ncbi:hypothetical protein F183_A21980 [Bryobacterales bacterium F-183]|nr:hypothetical protein F183_A21980 [Bryobacterales bacterium F-183]